MLKNIIEALFFSAGRGLTIDDIMTVFQDNYTKKEVQKAIEKIKEEYSADKGIVLIEYNNKYEFQSNTKYGEIIADVLTPIKERELSKTLLESLAIIAYKQPITRLEIEEIRGVSSDYAITMLLKFNLIAIAGRRDTLGKPLLYCTTDEFLRKFQLKSLEELPDYEELLDMIRNNFDKYYKTSQSLYRKEFNDDGELIDEAAASSDEETNFEILDQETPEFLKDEDTITIE